jgi:hypothetical protein
MSGAVWCSVNRISGTNMSGINIKPAANNAA